MVNILLNTQQLIILQQVCDYIGPQVSDIITCELPNLDKLVADWKDINRQLDAAQKTAIEVAGMVNQPSSAVKAIICRPKEA